MDGVLAGCADGRCSFFFLLRVLAQAAAPSELHAEEHRRLQRGTTSFDTSCDAGENCKTMAACDVANGYPMTEVSAVVHPSPCLSGGARP